jgi:hypothetical protein
MCISNNNDKNGLTSITKPNRFYKKQYEFTRVIREGTVQALHEGKEVELCQLKIVKITPNLKTTGVVVENSRIRGRNRRENA